jgi:hypothetical protein
MRLPRFARNDTMSRLLRFARNDIHHITFEKSSNLILPNTYGLLKIENCSGKVKKQNQDVYVIILLEDSINTF